MSAPLTAEQEAEARQLALDYEQGCYLEPCDVVPALRLLAAALASLDEARAKENALQFVCDERQGEIAALRAEVARLREEVSILRGVVQYHEGKVEP